MIAAAVPWRLLGVVDLAAITAKIRVPFDAWCDHWFAANRPTLDDATAIEPISPSSELDEGMETRHLAAPRAALAALGLNKPGHAATGSVAAILLDRLSREVRDDFLARLRLVLGASAQLLCAHDHVGSLPGGGASLNIRMEGDLLYRLVIEPASLAGTLSESPQPRLEAMTLSHAVGDSPVALEARLRGVSLPIMQLAALETGDVIRLSLPLNGNAFLYASTADAIVAEGHLCQRGGRLCVQLVDSKSHQSHHSAP